MVNSGNSKLKSAPTRKRGVIDHITTFFRENRRQARRIDALTLALEEHRREMRLALSALSLPDREAWLIPASTGQPAAGAGIFPYSTVCRQDSFNTPYFAFWTKALDEGHRYHRKIWEFVFICQALWERGALAAGGRGLGFGVGQEPLSAYFASQGIDVMATDMSAAIAHEVGWASSAQHADGKEALRRANVCPGDLFDRHVQFRTCDMNAVPEDLKGFDFCWSACALEHLGSIEKGLQFIERSVDCLKPGGWAVHTTEFNLSSNDGTVDDEHTVLFRRRDLEGLGARLRAKGHDMAFLDLEPGVGPIDRYIDLPPYRDHPHLQMALAGYSTTSVGLIIRRAL